VGLWLWLATASSALGLGPRLVIDLSAATQRRGIFLGRTPVWKISKFRFAGMSIATFDVTAGQMSEIRQWAVANPRKNCNLLM
jgi:hypothetical protein